MNEKNIQISISDVRDLTYIANHLQGEESVAEIIRLIDFPNDENSSSEALKAVVRFYSNVRYLVSQLNQTFSNQ